MGSFSKIHCHARIVTIASKEDDHHSHQESEETLIWVPFQKMFRKTVSLELISICHGKIWLQKDYSQFIVVLFFKKKSSLLVIFVCPFVQNFTHVWSFSFLCISGKWAAIFVLIQSFCPQAIWFTIWNFVTPLLGTTTIKFFTSLGMAAIASILDKVSNSIYILHCALCTTAPMYCIPCNFLCDFFYITLSCQHIQ